MTLLVAILTLAAAPAAARVAPPEGVDSIEHVPLPAGIGPVGLRVHSLDATLVLEAPRAAAQLARAVARAPRAVCGGAVEEAHGEVRLRCRSNRLVARLVQREGHALLEISETRGLPWGGEDGPPLPLLDPGALGLGSTCPGTTPAGRAECALASGDKDRARDGFERVADEPGRGLAALRLGDLAHASGALRLAALHWGALHGPIWGRMAAARTCELSWECVGDPARVGSLYAAEGLPPPLARDMAVRRGRALAFLGQPVEAARALTAGGPASSACPAAPGLCRQVALAAMRAPGADALEALALFVAMPRRDQSRRAYEAELAAAAIAQREGAPIFGANILAAGAGRVPAYALDEYLLRTAELYLAGGDPIRAGVVLDFARARSGKRGASGPRWAAISRGIAALRQRTSPAPQPAQPAAEPDPLLAAAERATQAARAMSKGRP